MAKGCAYLCRQCCFIDCFGEFSESDLLAAHCSCFQGHRCSQLSADDETRRAHRQDRRLRHGARRVQVRYCVGVADASTVLLLTTTFELASSLRKEAYNRTESLAQCAELS